MKIEEYHICREGNSDLLGNFFAKQFFGHFYTKLFVSSLADLDIAGSGNTFIYIHLGTLKLPPLYFLIVQHVNLFV